MDLVKEKLYKIERELKLLGLWQEDELDPALLESQQPFCCDTLRFEQWLQFVLIPKMFEILLLKKDLPKNMAIAPMAEYCWANQLDKQELIETLKEFDQMFSS